MRLIILLILALTLSACADSSPNTITNEGLTSIRCYVDSEAGVVCWVYSGIEKGGIDCLSISDTRLDP